jgi:SAM-dependent methyltransferase
LEHRPRYQSSTDELDAAEARWWREFGEVEADYCWVQPSDVRQFLRIGYLRRIIAELPRNGVVLDIGCGSGWLSSHLAASRDVRVLGVDFSEEQITRARESFTRGRTDDRLNFVTDNAQLDRVRALLPPHGADAIVLHAVLHHLSCEEIDRLFRTLRDQLAAPGAKVFILEPVRYAMPGAGSLGGAVRRLIDAWILMPLRGQRSGWRQMSAEEAKILARIDSRGASPKETPFLPDEIEELLGPYLNVTGRRPAMLFSFLVAKNLLLLRLSHRHLARFLFWPYLWFTRLLERAVLCFLPRSSGWDPFELITGTIRSDCGESAPR